MPSPRPLPPPLLRSLDLFSGIGGLTLALHDAAAPVAYCDASPHARAVLRANMAAGRLPQAPVCEDVRDMGARWLAAHASLTGGAAVDIVVAGFPCLGFSYAGRRRGFEDPHSGLFYELLRVVDETRPAALFLENTPAIRTDGMHAVARELCDRRGYDLRWCTLSARDVGAPQRRRRWFCLALRPGALLRLVETLTARDTTAVTAAKTFWERHREPRRMTPAPPIVGAARIVMLANAVVPDAARAAFEHLVRATAPHRQRTDADTRGEFLEYGTLSAPAVSTARPGSPTARQRSLTRPPKRPTESLGLVLVPDAYKANVPPHNFVKALARQPIHLDAWSTPTRASATHNNYLTLRNQRVLSVQARFEARTPDADRGLSLSPRFVEWVMGYPSDWTADSPSRAPSRSPTGRRAQ